MTKDQIKSTISYCKGRISALEFTLRPEARKYDKNRADKNQKKLDHFNVMLKCLEYCENEQVNKKGGRKMTSSESMTVELKTVDENGNVVSEESIEIKEGVVLINKIDVNLPNNVKEEIHDTVKRALVLESSSRLVSIPEGVSLQALSQQDKG